MTREQAIYEILEIIRGHQLSDDLDIDPREVEFNLDNARATILTQYLNKPGRLIPPVVIQDLGCVDLETADPAECCEVDTGCDVLRTDILPSFLNLNGKPLILRVGGVNKLHVSFSIVSKEQAVYSGNGKYNKQGIFAFLMNGRIYLVTNKKTALLLDKINIRGVFEHPSEIATFVNCDSDPCYTMASNYPIPADMYDTLKDMVLQKYGISIKMPKDDTNNANDVKIVK